MCKLSPLDFIAHDEILFGYIYGNVFPRWNLKLGRDPKSQIFFCRIAKDKNYKSLLLLKKLS